MYKFLSALNSVLGRLVSLALVGMVAVGGWFGYRTYHADKLAKQALEDAQKKVAFQQMEIDRLNTAVRLLKVDQRVAQVEVLSQEGSAKKGDLKTRFSFVELDSRGKPLEQPKTFEVQGDIVYLDYWVIKFSDEYIEQNDPLRSKSLILFRRIFGESQEPKDGFVLDEVGSEPTGYRGAARMSDFERQVWSRFWEYTNDADRAKKDGVRAAHGQANYTKLQQGKRYRVELRASDGMSIKPDETPARPGGPST